MMKYFSVEYIKRNWVMFLVIAIVFGALIWLFMARGSGGGGVVTQVNSTAADPVAAAAQTQIALANIQAGMATNQANAELAALGIQADTQLQLGMLEAQLRQQETAASERLGAMAVSAQLESMDMQLSNALAMQEANNQFQVDFASQAYDAAIAQTAINAQLQQNLSAQQLEAYKMGLQSNAYMASLSVIPSLRKKDRDNALAAISGASGYRGGTYPGAAILPDLSSGAPIA